MTVDLNFAHGHALQVSAGSGTATVNLTPGTGAHCLAVTVTLISVGLAEGLPIQLSGELYMELNDAHRWLGPLHLKQVATRSFQITEQLICSLSDSQLRAIESLRDGRDLPLRLRLDAVLVHPVDGLYPVVQGQDAAFVPAGSVGSATQRTRARERTQAQRRIVLTDDFYSLASGANHDDPVTESPVLQATSAL